MDTYIVGRPLKEAILRLRSLERAGDVYVDLQTGEGPKDGWGRYATGVVRAALDEGWDLRGFDGVLASDVPIGAGLSSSAALEVAIAMAVLADDHAPLDLARMCCRAENVYCGIRCGIMDQLAATSAISGNALLIDCLDETYEPVPVPERITVLVIDSAVPRSLVESGYNERRAECEQAARALGVEALRFASLGDLDNAKLDQRVARRALHVLTENDRVINAVEALRTGNVVELGPLFAESHRSQSQDFEVSTPEVDALVEIAQGTPGVIAARMTGGGFGGCTVNLVESDAERDAAQQILTMYERRTGLRARCWISRPAAGASAVS